MEGITYVYVFCNLTKVLEIKMTLKNKVTALFTSESYVLGTLLWYPAARMEWNAAWKMEPPKAQTWSPAEGKFRWAYFLGLLVGTRQEGWPSAVRHPLRTTPLTNYRDALHWLWENSVRDHTPILPSSHLLTSFVLYMIALLILQNIHHVYME